MAACILYVAATVGINLPFVRTALAGHISEMLSEMMGVKVEISDVHIGLPNRIEISDITICDTTGQPTFTSSHVGTRMVLRDYVANNKILLSKLEVYNTQIAVSRPSADAPLNIQSIIDRLNANPDSTTNSPEVIIRTLIVRNLSVRYDVTDQPATKNLFNPNHIALNNVDANLRINHVGSDSLNLRVRDFAFCESSGLCVSHMQGRCEIGPHMAKIMGVKFQTQNSKLVLSDIVAQSHLAQASNRGFHVGDFSNATLKGYLQPSDFTSLMPSLAALSNYKFNLDTQFEKHNQTLNADIALHNQANHFNLDANVKVLTPASSAEKTEVEADIRSLAILPTTLRDFAAAFAPDVEVPTQLDALGSLYHKGTIASTGSGLTVSGQTSTDIGLLTEDIRLHNNIIDATVTANAFHLGRLCGNESMLGELTGTITAKGEIDPANIQVESRISSAEINQYNYNDILLTANYQPQQVSAHIESQDPNALLHADGLYFPTEERINATLDIAQLSPEALQLLKNQPDVMLDGRIHADVNLKNGMPLGSLSLSSLSMSRNDTLLASLDTINCTLRHSGDIMEAIVNGAMAEGRMRGNIKLEDLPLCFTTIVKRQMPALGKDLPALNGGNKYVDFDLTLKDLSLVEQLLHLPVNMKNNASIIGRANTATNELLISAAFPSFALNGEDYHNTTLYLKNVGDSISLLAQTTKAFEASDAVIVVSTMAHADSMRTEVGWKTQPEANTRGTLQANAIFSQTENNGLQTHLRLSPSDFYIGDSVWHIASSSFDIAKGLYRVNNFSVSHDNQYLTLSSTTPDVANGKGLACQINDIDLEYVFDLLNFHPVYFSGLATGTVITTDLSERQDFDANLVVRQFKFNHGDMGTLRLKGAWRNDEQTVLLDAVTSRGQNDSTLIKGHVAVGADSIHLDFNSTRTNVAFLNHYLGSIFDNITGYCNGKLTLTGPLGSMSLIGDEELVDVRLAPYALNTSYTIRRDTVHFRYNRFLFDNVTMEDNDHHKATINGHVRHRVLHDFGVDLHFLIDNMLLYDHDDSEGGGFWGKIYGDATCHLHGPTDDVNIDVDITPRSGSSFVYNSSGSATSSSAEFIRFKPTTLTSTIKSASATSDNKPTNDIRKDTSADIHLNLNINANPNVNFIILTDSKTGDNMSLYGSGELHANYYNKGKFQIFGTYTVDHGAYKITIQDIIHKNFSMQRGGTLRFNGAPDDGDLDLRGKLTISSVSLSDLNLGNISNSNTNVDCILFFRGKTMEPIVSFDIDFPNVNDDEKQMVRNMIASQGDINMQIIYLLSIGRFFTYDYSTFNSGSNQGQTSVAMNSLLANTLSGQINNMLSNALHLTNWSFGTNLATGRMGWSDVEVEGTMAGSLLNNRLLVNGKFGYREQATTYNNDFVGDFNVRLLLNKSGTISLKGYSETNDRYFTKSSLTTNGAGILFQRDFNSLSDFFAPKRKENKQKLK